MEPQRKTFHSVVEEVSNSSDGNPRSFKNLAKNVLSREHKELRSQGVIAEENVSSDREENKLDEIAQSIGVSDEELSDCVSNDISENSDWSDEELETLEKRFGAMSDRREEYEKIRQIRKSRRETRRARQNYSPCSSGASSWDLARLVYSRDSSISGFTASSLNSSTVDLDKKSLDGCQNEADIKY